MGWRNKSLSLSVREEPKPPGDGNLMRLDRIPTGQLTSASASLTKPPGPFMPRPDANKENQSEHTYTHPNRFCVHDQTLKTPDRLQDRVKRHQRRKETV
ncbi:hypothetical protein EYF80_032510 [Liparis tanakae]|uniref:Uncharacterized protein n=1 Tax=Liparis tanakae TaxID=230148 RepID=A0A4Z2GV68_9TELE|nr:hypothetical protein EYF80_032510 [Liparis tanakae]